MARRTISIQGMECWLTAEPVVTQVHPLTMRYISFFSFTPPGLLLGQLVRNHDTVGLFDTIEGAFSAAEAAAAWSINNHETL